MAKRIAIALFLLVNLMTLIAGSKLLPDVQGDKAGALFLGLTFTATLVHEAGHAIAAVALGARLRVIAVWDFGYDFKARRFGFQKSRASREIAGYVLYDLSGTARSMSRRIQIAAAGPGANFVAALGAMYLRSMFMDMDISGALTLFAILSVGMALANLLPFAGSDGQTIWNNRKAWL